MDAGKESMTLQIFRNFPIDVSKIVHCEIP